MYRSPQRPKGEALKSKHNGAGLMTHTTSSRTTATITPTPPIILVVDDEPAFLDMIYDVIARQIDCRLYSAANREQAVKLMRTHDIDLLLADRHLPDGDGMDLLADLKKLRPGASAIVITGDASVSGAIEAIRQGAADFVPKPVRNDQLVERMKAALARRRAVARNEKRMDRLREAVKRLNEARRTVGKKVDLLCNDLIGAYGDLSRQFDELRTSESFRKALHSAGDLEQMLCHCMDWLLKRLGYCNIGIWLAAEEGEFQLGAYMKYTVIGDDALAAAMRDGVVQAAVRQGFIHLTGEQCADQLTDAESDFLTGQTILGSNAIYLGETLGALVLFRDQDAPFTQEDEQVLKDISPIFALALSSMVKGITKDEAPNDDNPEFGKPSKQEDGDWWKRGESPPF